MRKILILFALFALGIACSGGLSDVDVGNSTLNGSYARLLTIDNYLYAINEQELTTIDVTDPDQPIVLDKQNVGFDIENLFHYDGVLFIGSQTALHIFLIGPDGIPKRKSQTGYFDPNSFVTSCDPVIVSDNTAYVTLSSVQRDRGFGRCVRTLLINELRIYDVLDINQPELLSTMPLENPKGLAIDGDYLFVCLEFKGLTVLNVKDPKKITEIITFTGFESYDVIAKDGLLMVVCPTEIRQYDYSDINKIQYLSSIEL